MAEILCTSCGGEIDTYKEIYDYLRDEQIANLAKKNNIRPDYISICPELNVKTDHIMDQFGGAFKGALCCRKTLISSTRFEEYI